MGAQTAIFVAMIFPSVMVVLVGILGIFTCGRPPVIIAFMIAASCLAVVLLSFGGMVLGRHSLPQEWHCSLNLALSDPGLNATVIQDKNMADIALALGACTSWSAQEISVMLEANQTAVGIALIILAVVIIVAVLPISAWNLKLARSRTDAKEKSHIFNLPGHGKETELPRKVGKNRKFGEMTTFTPIPSDESDLQQNEPQMLEMVTVKDDDADMSMSRHLSPNHAKDSAVRNEHRGGPTAPPETPATTEDSVILLSKKDSTASMSEDDWTPVHKDGKRVVR